MTEKTVLMGVRIKKEVYEEFKNYVLKKYGKIKGVMGVEVEFAIKQYLSKQLGTKNTKTSLVESIVDEILKKKIDPDNPRFPILVEKLARGKYGITGEKFLQELIKTVSERIKYLKNQGKQ